MWPSVGSRPSKFSPEMLKGAFQPLADMWKDVKNTIKPYRTNVAILNDALEPIYGLGNLLKGGVYLVLIVPLFLFNLFRYAIEAKRFSQWAELALVLNGVKTLGWLIDGVLSLVRGATQLMATPLGWFIKMPLRGIITCFTDKKDLKIEKEQPRQPLATDTQPRDGSEDVENTLQTPENQPAALFLLTPIREEESNIMQEEPYSARRQMKQKSL